MRRLVRAVWGILPTVSLLAAGAALSALPEAIARYSAEPEDVYGLAVIAALLIVLGVLIIALGLIDSMDAPVMTGIGGVAMVSGAPFLWLVHEGDRAAE